MSAARRGWLEALSRGHSPGLAARRAWLEASLILFWLLTLVRPTLSNGDAACYLTQILQHDFSLRTVHIGYLWSALPWVKALSWGAAVDPAVRLNLFSVAWGLAGWAALRRLERLVRPDRAPGLAGLCWLACPPVLLELTTAEVYPAQVALLLWALAAWGEERPVVSGLLWAAAMSVSPTSLAALPAFTFRERSRRDWILLLVVGLAPMAALAGWLRTDYLEGPRGLLHAPAGMSLDESLWLRLSALPRTLGWGVAGLVVGTAAALGGRWPAGRRLLLAIVLQAAAVWLLVDRYRDVPAQGLSIALLALLTAEGWRELAGWGADLAGGARAGSKRARLWWAGIAFLLLLQAVMADQEARAERRREAAFAALARRVHASMPAGGKVMGSWSDRRLYEWYNLGRTPAEITLELSSDALEGPGAKRLLRLPEAGAMPVGGQLRLEPDGGWTWEQEGRR